MASASGEPAVKALIVCLGNICRSPMGEAVLKATAEERGLSITVDSCGTAGYHVGDEPDYRTIATCKKHNVSIDHLGRKISSPDFTNFTHILAADENNLTHIQGRKPQNSSAKICLWGDYLDGKPIPDPYYGGISDFEKVFEQCKALSNAFLDDVFGTK